MKKIILSLVGLLAAAAFAPQASAVPAFARQTSMACNACHFQSYPVLTSFGKSFKTAGYTLMGAQPLIEGEHGLSLPSNLNAGVYMQARVNQEDRGNNGKAAIDIPDEFALFLGGRVTENAGVLVEYNLKTGGYANLKFPQVYDMGGMKVSLVPFSTDGLGPQFGFDLFATGSTANGRVIENGEAYSASMYLGTNAAAAGAAIVVANDQFHVVVTPYAGARTNDIASANTLGATYVRVAYTPSVAGWDIGVGVQSYRGDALKGACTNDAASTGVGPVVVTAGTCPSGTTKEAANIIDAQAQGELAGMPVGIYASYGSAAGTAAGAVTNHYNSGTETRSALGVLAEVGVVPGTLMVDVAYMMAKTGLNVAAVAGTNETDNAVTVGAKYKLAQNMKLGFAYTMNSGTAYDAGGSNGLRGKNRLSVVYSFGF